MINSDVFFFQKLVNLISNDVLCDKSKVLELYTDWEKNFEEQRKPYLTDVVKKSAVSKNQYLPKNATTAGIDLPTWYGNVEKKRILFLGIDPMRKASEFINNGVGNIEDDVIVGTPYAFHHSSFRTNRTKAYWEIIDKLKFDNFIYVTDIFKSFFYTNDKVRSYDYFMHKDRKDEQLSHRKLLKAEIKLIVPDLIVTFGGLSFKLLMNSKFCPKLSQPINKILTQFENIPVLPLMHLSGSTREKPLQCFFYENGIKWEEADGRTVAAKNYSNLISRILKKMDSNI